MHQPPTNGPIKNVVFDLGGVLVQWDPDALLSRLYANRQDQRTIKEAVFLHEDWKEFDRGTLSEADAVSAFSQRTDRSTEEIRTLMTCTKESLDILPGSLDLLAYLKGRHINLYCLSNMNAPTLAYLKNRHDFWNLFSGVMISGDLQLLKPEPEIYQRLLSEYQLKASETLLVDDQPSNVIGAETVGMSGIWFTSPDDCRRQLQPLIDEEKSETEEPTTPAPPPFTIRLAEERDAETLADFNIAMAQETEERQLARNLVLSGVRGLMARPDHGFYLVAETEGSLVGSLMVTFEWSDWRDGFFWWIQSVYIQSAFRRKGVYRNLYQAVKDRASEAKVCGFRLYVEHENTIAQKTYESLGMSEIPYRMYEEGL